MKLYKTEEFLDGFAYRGLGIIKRFEGYNGVEVEIKYNTEDFSLREWQDKYLMFKLINEGFGPNEVIEVNEMGGFRGAKMPVKGMKPVGRLNYYDPRTDIFHTLGEITKVEVFSDGWWTYSKYDINRIYHNNAKNTTVVEWMNGAKTKVKVADGEDSYIYNAVAAAVMKRKYGSNSAFKTHIRKNLGGYNDTAYLIMARDQASEIYGGYEAFKKIVDEKLILQG